MEEVLDDDEEKLSPEEELEKLNLGKKHIEKMILTCQSEIKDLTIQHNIFHTKKSNLLFELERIYAKKQSLLWWFIIVSSALLILHSYSHKVYVFCFVNAYAFLVNWKALYVKEVPYAKTVAFILNVITLKFV